MVGDTGELTPRAQELTPAPPYLLCWGMGEGNMLSSAPHYLWQVSELVLRMRKLVLSYAKYSTEEQALHFAWAAY